MSSSLTPNKSPIDKWFLFIFTSVLFILFSFVPMAGETGFMSLWKITKLGAIFIESVIATAVSSLFYFAYKNK